MKPICFFLLLFFFTAKENHAQVTAVNYAVNYSVKMNGYKSIRVKERRNLCEERNFNAVPEFDRMTVIEKMGLDHSTKRTTQRDTLLSLYPPIVFDLSWFESHIFDSISNTLAISYDNTMFAYSILFAFDSAGKLIRSDYSFQSEAGGQGETTTLYAYSPQKNTVTKTILTGSSIIHVQEIVWDPTHQFPLKETITDKASAKTMCYRLVYRKNSIYKLYISETENNKTVRNYCHKYLFDN